MSESIEVTKREKLDVLYRNWPCEKGRRFKDFRIYQAICRDIMDYERLKKKVEEWQLRIRRSEIGMITGSASNAFRILEEIRDFRKEADDE
jgi:hypothetical protein